MANSTFASPDALPPLPAYTLQLVPPLVPPIADKYFALLAPIIGYWIMSGIFHVMDTYDLCAKYRLHTPAEVLRRNRVSKKDVLRDVIIQQVVQTIFGAFMGMLEVQNVSGRKEYDVAVWATRLRWAQRGLPVLLTGIGVDAMGLSTKASNAGHSILAGVLSGGRYPGLTTTVLGVEHETFTPAFAQWELLVAKVIYWAVIPALQFLVAILIVDTWQYFLHRGMHMNKYLYTTLHARHHRLYVPYAYGALYNHPVEGFLLDTVGTGLAYMAVGMTARQGMLFFAGSSIKTVDDHCGYALPWDPLQHLTSNNAGYHDIHHQSWGIKTNFSQPFFTFWDRALGTMWTGGDVSARYARDRANVERLLDKENAKEVSGQPDPVSHTCAAQSLAEDLTPYESESARATHLTAGMQAAAIPSVPAGKATAQAIGSRDQVLEDHQGGGPTVLYDEAAEEVEALEKASWKAGRPARRSTGSGSLKGLRERLDGKLRGRARDVMKVESSS